MSCHRRHVCSSLRPSLSSFNSISRVLPRAMSFPPSSPNRQNSSAPAKAPSPLSSGVARPYGGGSSPYPPPAPEFPSTPSFDSYASHQSYAPVHLDADETAPLSANAAPLSGVQQQLGYPGGISKPDFIGQDPHGGPRPTLGYSSTITSQQSSADWQRRAATVKRGVTRRVKLTRGNFIAVGDSVWTT